MGVAFDAEEKAPGVGVEVLGEVDRDGHDFERVGLSAELHEVSGEELLSRAELVERPRVIAIQRHRAILRRNQKPHPIPRKATLTRH